MTLTDYINRILAYAETLPEPTKSILYVVADIAQNDPIPYKGIIKKTIAHSATNGLVVTRLEVARALRLLRLELKNFKD